jgi:hypothetical protein
MLKTRFALGLLMLCAGSTVYAQGPTSLSGTWEMRSGKWVLGGQENTLPGNLSGGQLKTYSNGHFLFVGQTKSGPDVQNNFGGGTYTLKGEDYAETLTYHVAPALVGRTLHFKLVVKGDTMTLTGPVSTEDQKVLGGTLTEVYVRKD